MISSRMDLCGEAPVWDGESGKLWWSDMLAARIFCRDAESGRITEHAVGKNVSGMAVNRGGGLVCACHEGVYLWSEARGAQLVAEELCGHRLACNDAVADAKGRFLFGTTFYGPQSVPGEYELGKLISLAPNGRFTVLDEGIHLANGLGFSPNGKTLYFADTVPRVIYAYDYDIETGSVANRRVFATVPGHEGIPDGLTVDEEGYVWSARWYGACVVRHAPDGSVDRVLPMPVRQVSSVMFGGAGLRELFITTAGKSVRLSAAPPGYDFEAQNVGGPLYRAQPGAKGLPEHKADIRL